MWTDLHQQYARERHRDLLRQAERERLAAKATRPRRELRLRVGRLVLCWNCMR